MTDDMPLQQRIARAIRLGERRSGRDASLDDFIAPLSDEQFTAQTKAAEAVLGELREAAVRLQSLHQEPRGLSPVALAIMDQMPPGSGNYDAEITEAALDAIALLASLPLAEYVAANKRSKRGNKTHQDYRLRAAVRAAVHHLHICGNKISGGWTSVDRDKSKLAKRTSDEDLKASGPAKIIVDAVREARLTADHAAIMRQHKDYISELKGRAPQESDYIPEFLPEQGS